MGMEKASINLFPRVSPLHVPGSEREETSYGNEVVRFSDPPEMLISKRKHCP